MKSMTSKEDAATAVSIIDRAISNYRGGLEWTFGHNAINKQGEEVSAGDKSVCSVCVIGSIFRAASELSNPWVDNGGTAGGLVLSLLSESVEEEVKDHRDGKPLSAIDPNMIACWNDEVLLANHDGNPHEIRERVIQELESVRDWISS